MTGDDGGGGRGQGRRREGVADTAHAGESDAPAGSTHHFAAAAALHQFTFVFLRRFLHFHSAY